MQKLIWVLGLSALVTAGIGAAAQTNEPLTLDKKVLSLAAARKIIAASEAEARARSLGVVIVVVDDAGNIIQLTRMDAAQVASVNVGIGKARTAAIYRRPSRVFEEQIKNGRVAALALADATPLQGGVPITIDGKVVGAVGVSGDSPQADEEIALAGVEAIRGNASVGRIERLDPRFDTLIPRGAGLEKVAEGIEWAEGPLWDTRDGSLLFSDVPRNAVYRWKQGAGVTLFLDKSGYSGKAPFTGREPGSNGLAFDREGRLVMCQHGDRRIARREKDGRLTVLADRYQGRRLNSPNDLVYRSDGSLYFTDPPFGLPGTFADPAREIPFQGVYRLAPDGTLSLLTTELNAPNGIAFSPDEKTLYVSNAEHTRPVWMAYDVLEDGTLGRGRQFAEASAWVKEGEGAPDGLKVDKSGNVFAAGPGGIHVFAPDGTRLGRIETGVATGNVTWGENGRALYVAATHWICRVRTTTKG